MAGLPTIGVPSRRTYRTLGMVSPTTGSIGSTRVDAPSLTASDVLEVPKSRPKRTGSKSLERRSSWQAALRTGERPLGDQVFGRTLDNTIDRHLDTPSGKRTSTRVR